MHIIKIHLFSSPALSESDKLPQLESRQQTRTIPECKRSPIDNASQRLSFTKKEIIPLLFLDS